MQALLSIRNIFQKNINFTPKFEWYVYNIYKCTTTQYNMPRQVYVDYVHPLIVWTEVLRPFTPIPIN